VVRVHLGVQDTITKYQITNGKNIIVLLIFVFWNFSLMVSVAQLVRAPGCGPGGRGFKSHRSPLFNLFFIRPHRLVVRTSPFHGGNRGSNPLGVTKSLKECFKAFLFSFRFNIFLELILKENELILARRIHYQFK
jgi:hypothetical protein